MAKFSIGFREFATTTANKTAMKVINSAAHVFEVTYVACYGGGATAAADTQHEINAGFLSAAGAGTAGASPTPEKDWQFSAASGMTAGTAYSAEPTTYATNVFPLFCFNQRSGAVFAVPRGEGLMAQGGDTSLNLGVRVISSAAGVISGRMSWWE